MAMYGCVLCTCESRSGYWKDDDIMDMESDIYVVMIVGQAISIPVGL